MLRYFSKLKLNFSAFSPTLTPLPLHLQLLSQKLPFLQSSHLQSLTGSQLEQYFNDKMLQNFTLEDIYFYMRQPQINPSKQILLSLISNPSIDTYTAFAITQNSNNIDDPHLQKMLFSLFNQTCQELQIQSLLYCLRILVKIGLQDVKTIINLQALTKRIREKQQQFNMFVFELICHLSDLEILSTANIPKHTQQIQKQLSSIISQQNLQKCTINELFYVCKTIQKVSLPLSISMQDRKALKSIIQRKIKHSSSNQQLQCCVNILQFYPQFVYTLPIHLLSPSNYIAYLNILNSQKQNNHNFTLLHHLLPPEIYTVTSSQQFSQIIRLRVLLGLENLKQIGKMCKKIMTTDMNNLLGLVKYLGQNNIEVNQIWNDIQQGFLAKLNLTSKKNRDIIKITREYNIAKVFTFLAFISARKLGSTIFWKYSYHFVYDILSNEQLIQNIKAEDQNYFIIDCFRIYGMRTIPTHVEQILVSLSLVALTNNRWTISSLYYFTKTLTYYKIGNHEIWYAIESKLLVTSVHKNMSQIKKQRASLIFLYFKQMKFGTHRLLKKKLKLQQNKTIPNQESILAILEQAMSKHKIKNNQSHQSLAQFDLLNQLTEQQMLTHPNELHIH